MQQIFIVLLAILLLAVSVLALECYITDGVTSLSCTNGATYCDIIGTEDLQTLSGAGCLNPTYNYLCESFQCKYDSTISGYIYCCTTDYCNTKAGKTCVTTTTSTTSTTASIPSASSKLMPSDSLIFSLIMLLILLIKAFF